MGLHPWLRSHAARGSLFLVYGPPGSGKTALSLELLRFSEEELGLDTCLIATETGTLLAVRHRSWAPGAVVEAYSLLDLLQAVVECAGRGAAVAVDSANSLYRVEGASIDAGAMLSLASALLRSRSGRGVPAVMTAQVSLDGSEVPGWRFMAPWANVILRMEARGGRRIVVGEKPSRMLLEYRIGEGGVVEWI
ncbi:P-loop NTPase family protein [Stetteria hydrogenophila]